MQTVQRTIVSVKPGKSELGTAWSDGVGLPAGTKMGLVTADDTVWRVEFLHDQIDNKGTMHYQGEYMDVFSKAFTLEA
jgi:hypothetical protein